MIAKRIAEYNMAMNMLDFSEVVEHSRKKGLLMRLRKVALKRFVGVTRDSKTGINMIDKDVYALADKNILTVGLQHSFTEGSKRNLGMAIAFLSILFSRNMDGGLSDILDELAAFLNDSSIETDRPSIFTQQAFLAADAWDDMLWFVPDSLPDEAGKVRCSCGCKLPKDHELGVGDCFRELCEAPTEQFNLQQRGYFNHVGIWSRPKGGGSENSIKG